MKLTLAIAVGLAGLAVATIAEAQQRDRHVKIVNNTDSTMETFQASNVRRKTWEEDILGKDVLRPGQSVNVNVNDGTGACMFDFRAKFKDGSTATKKNVDVCKISTFTFNN